MTANNGEQKSNGILDYLAKISELIMVVLTMAMILLVSYQVFERYVLHYTPPWSEELAVYLMIWFGMIGIGVGMRHGSHMALHFFADLMPKKVQNVLEYIKYLLILGYTSVLLYQGINMVKFTMAQKSPAIGLPVGYVYLSLPVCAALLLIFTLELLMKHFRNGGDK